MDTLMKRLKEMEGIDLETLGKGELDSEKDGADLSLTDEKDNKISSMLGNEQNKDALNKLGLELLGLNAQGNQAKPGPSKDELAKKVGLGYGKGKKIDFVKLNRNLMKNYKYLES